MKAIQRLKSLFVAPSQLQNAETKEKTFAFVSSFGCFSSLCQPQSTKDFACLIHF
jgi:hypothetical protein